MKLTCKYLKTIIPEKYHHRIYKSGSDVRIDLIGYDDETIKRLIKITKEHNIIMYRDNLVYLPNNYIVRYENV